MVTSEFSKTQVAEVRGSLLVRNTILNFIGHLVPLLVGVIAIPFVIRGLGTERFGILSLAWGFLAYFSLFDLGLGRATTKFVAEALGRGERDRLPVIAWSSLLFQFLLGIVGGIILVIITPFLVHQVFNISFELLKETETTFYILAASVPVVVSIGGLRGILEAGQRFDLVNAVKIPLSSLVFFIPAVAVFLKLRLDGVALLLLVTNLGAVLAYLLLCFGVFPTLRQGFSIQFRNARPLFAYGGWLAFAQVVWSFMLQIDRFFIGSLISVAAVAFYAAPFEMVTRLWILPASLITLFPAFSTLGESRQHELVDLYTRSIKHLLLVMGPVVIILILYASKILGLWLGQDFRAKSTLVLQVLALGVLVNSLASVPDLLLKGLGYPSTVAKIHILLLPIYATMAWFCIRHFGIVGAAIAWTLRAFFETILLFGASWRLIPSGSSALVEKGVLRQVLMLFMLLAAMLSAKILSGGLTPIVFTMVFVAIYIVFSWHYVLDIRDRTALKAVIRLTAR